MRKPLVVVCAATSALVLAGGVAATSAGADESPDVPGFSLPGFDWLGFGSDAGDIGDIARGGMDRDADAGTGDDMSYDDGAAGDDRMADGDAADRDGAARDQGADAHDQGADRQDAQQQGAQKQDQADPNQGGRDQDGQDQGGQGQDGLGQGGRGQGSRADREPAADRAALQQRHADTAEQPAAVRRGAVDLMAAARENVTAASVSASPNSPMQQQVLALINQNRRRGGCDALSVDRRLIDAANEHAADMARRRYFAHESPGGEGAGDRVSEAGYRWQRYGENIARGADSAWEVVNGWMNSPEHRRNILDCRLHQMGVGLAIAGDDTPYWVQDFATPMS